MDPYQNMLKSSACFCRILYTIGNEENEESICYYHAAFADITGGAVSYRKL